LGEKQRRKAHIFAKHLADVFQPHPSENELEEEEALIQLTYLPTLTANHIFQKS
jgi:hypothetical protein